jgi:diguanylate cyclase (GGDEF)-like protein/PAS domain S-box-containing protein
LPKLNNFWWRSLQTRLPLFALTIFIASIWAMSFFASRTLREDMQHMLGEQHLATITVIAEQVNEELVDQFKSLNIVAADITPALLGKPAGLQLALEHRPVFQQLFNGGTFITGPDGIALASVPLSVGRRGVSYIDRDFIMAALKDGKATVGRPVLGKKLAAPIFVVAVPIRDAKGLVIGALAGITDLSRPSFLDHVTQNHYGKTGGYLLSAPQYRLIVTGSDKSRIMQPFPAPGINPMLDRYVDGYEGYGVSVNSRGVEELTAAKGVPVAGWFMALTLPTEEAYAPIHAMQQHMDKSLFALILLAGGITWLLSSWNLRRQLTPIRVAAKLLASDSAAGRVPKTLPVEQSNEVGELLDGFNRSIGVLAQRELAIKAQEVFKQAILNSMDAQIAVLDHAGTIVMVNESWHRFATQNSAEPSSLAPSINVGANYLTVCSALGDNKSGGATDACHGIMAVLNGTLPTFTLDYPCHSPLQHRWFTMVVTPLKLDTGFGAVVVHTNITDRKQAEANLIESSELNRAVSDNGQALIWLAGLDKGCHHFNKPWLAFTGRTLEQEIGNGWVEGVHPDDLQRCLDIYVTAFDRHERFSMVYRLRHHTGDYRWILDDGAPRFDSAGCFVGYVGHCLDITDMRKAEDEIRIAATAFESQLGITITDANKVILRVNQAFTEITGYTAEEAVGQTPKLISSGRHDAAFYSAMWERIALCGTWQGEIWNRRKNGEVFPEWLTISGVTSDSGLTTHYVGTFSDITLRKTSEDSIQRLAFYDPLTGLPNRRLLMDRLAQALAAGMRHPRQGALLFVDLDNFKILNDTMGHHQGDLLLEQVSTRLSTCIRECDTVARLGGDEFVVMLEDLSVDALKAATQAESVGEKILLTLNRPYQIGEHTHHSTPSIGITLFGSDPLESIDEPLKRADLAMYQAKAAGRNTLRFFDPQMQSVVSARAAMEAGLQLAIQEGQFLLHYQGQVTNEERLTGAEALVRWLHPLNGMVSPAEFIPLAEDTGIILPLGAWVLQTACAQLALWATQPALAHLTVAVNVSARQFHHPSFVSGVLGALERSGANPARLKLELTESLLVTNVDEVINKMNVLKEIGIHFSLDDFGTGYSSLAYLKRLPLDQLKIDQGFVKNILLDPNDAAIAKMVIALADTMGLAVIAEGVETQEQRDFLEREGCHAYQGYFFSRPLPIDAFEKLAATDKLAYA